MKPNTHEMETKIISDTKQYNIHNVQYAINNYQTCQEARKCDHNQDQNQSIKTDSKMSL